MRIRLAIRYSFFSGLVLLVVMIVSTFFHINKVQGLFAEIAMNDADALADLILRNSYHLMMEDDRRHLQLLVEEVSESQMIERIRILGREGVVSFSTNIAEVGTALDMQDDSCAFCHVADTEALVDVPVEDRTQMVAGRYMNVTRGIYNDPGCFTAACHVHPPDQEKIGVLDMAVSIEQLEKLTEMHERDVLMMIVFMLLALILCHGLLTRKLIEAPIEKLLEQTAALSAGDLSARVKSLTRDELGELGRSFNLMADNLQRAQSELQQWTNTLEQRVNERTMAMSEMQEQLIRSAKLASLGELVAGIAHEINNPLTGILMFSSLSAKHPDLPPPVKENLKLIMTETDRCAKIVRGLLEFARESIPEKKPSALNKIIEHTIALVTYQVFFQDVEIDCRLDPNLPEIELDVDQWQQVLLNMFINAAQAMPQGGVLLVASEYIEERGLAQIRIEDNGEGIDQEHIDKIFDPFFSTKAQKGLGLGLSVSYGIIKNHGGNIKVESTLGQGTRFIIELPVKAGSSRETEDAADDTSTN